MTVTAPNPDILRLAIDADGIALVTWDMADRSMNVITEAVMDAFEAVIALVAKDPAIKGAVIASGKPTFSGGADLKMLHGLFDRYDGMRDVDPKKAAATLFEESGRLSRIFRGLETSGKPWVAAIGGLCLGGAFELSLSCHARLVAADDRLRMGLPEIKVGLFPGAGGSQRVMRLAEPQAGLTMMMQGQTLSPEQAKAMNLVHAVVPAAGLIEAAKGLIREGRVPAVQPWDRPDFRLPAGKVYSPGGMQFWPAANALYRRETQDNYPAARGLLKAVFEGLQLPIDRALTVESRYFAEVLRSREAAVMIRSLFVSNQALKKGARRPHDVPPTRLGKLGMIGAGFMGAGIAHVAARAGIEVVLIDRDRESAEKGLAHAASMLARDVDKGRLMPAARDAILARIRPSADYAELAGADLVIEAVFEDRAVKRAAIAAAEAVIGSDTIFASNTSTLPITSLAEASARPDNFIGIHFFSPVEKMMLVEIIRGRNTGPRALAVALDFVRLLDKTPIVVEDGRGFYTSRVVMTYIREGVMMLSEGVPSAMIENVARAAGMPVGPLALADEVALDLCHKIGAAAAKDLGAAYRPSPLDRIMEEMVVARGRFGRKNRAGFYDYPADGRKALWPGLAEVAGPARPADSFDVATLRARLLGIQALETARIFEEGILTDVREADVGSILGFGFAPYTGGTLSYVDSFGTDTFAHAMRRLAEAHGARFQPNALLDEMAARGETFYGRYG